jgi:hypothetical protein
MIHNNLLCITSIILGVFTLNQDQSRLLLFHQIQYISTYYIELKSNGSIRTNMPMPTCSLFCPLLPLQDYLMQGWYSSFSLYYLLGLLPHHHCIFCKSLLLVTQTMVDSFYSPHQNIPLLLPVLLLSHQMNFPQAYPYENLYYVY